MKVKVLTSCKINVIEDGEKVLRSCKTGDIVEVSSLADIHRIVKEVTEAMQAETVEKKSKKRRSKKNRKVDDYETR